MSCEYLENVPGITPEGFCPTCEMNFCCATKYDFVEGVVYCPLCRCQVIGTVCPCLFSEPID